MIACIEEEVKKVKEAKEAKEVVKNHYIEFSHDI